MTDIVLCRHGETVWHAENRYAGRSDIDLTEEGTAQAETLAAWAATAGLAAVYSSTLARARRTAAPCAAKAGLPLAQDERLQELDFGRAEGLTAAEMEHEFPEALHAFRHSPASRPLPGGEDPFGAAARFVGALREIADRHPGQRVLAVAHTTAIRLALCDLIGVPLDEYRRLFPAVRNCALTEIRLGPGQASLLQFNSPPTPGA